MTLRTTASVLVGWKPPENGWSKINVDGSVLQASSSGACSGIIRDSNGLVLAGFMMNIGKVTITEAELWAIYMGLKIGIDMGFNKIKVESDSTCAVRLIQNSSTSFHGSTTLIRAIKELQTKPGEFEIDHIHREANFSADELAKHAHSLLVGLHQFVALPPFITHTLDADRKDMKFARFAVFKNLNCLHPLSISDNGKISISAGTMASNIEQNYVHEENNLTVR
ncbi:hypothetical protein AHAS_Ahas20G0129000 [Arachis hypogaea]